MEVYDEVWYAIDIHFRNVLFRKIKIEIELVHIKFLYLVEFFDFPESLLIVWNEYDGGFVNVVPLKVDAHFCRALAFIASFN